MSTNKEAKNNDPVDPGQKNNKKVTSTSDFLSDPNMHFVEAIGKWTYTSDDGVTLQFDEDQQQWTQIVNYALVNNT
jgi:HIV Tat-specific factor 1